MALQEQHVAIKFAGGIETKMDAKAVPSTKLLALENGVFTKAISIKKRNGYSAKSKVIDGSTTLFSDGRRLAARDTELLAFTSKKCFSQQTDNDQWTDTGAVFSVTGTDRAVVNTSTQQTMPDHASLNGVTAYAWEDSRGGVYYTVVDESNASTYKASTLLDALGSRPRCVVSGEAIHIYYAVPTTGCIMIVLVNPTSPTTTLTPAILVSDLHATNPVYDVCATTRSGTPNAIVWNEAATTNYRVGYVDSSGVLGSPVTGHPSVWRELAGLDAASPIAVAFKYVDGADDDVLVVGAVIGISAEARVFSGGTTSLAIGGTLNRNCGMMTPASTGPSSVQRVGLAIVGLVVWMTCEETAATASNRFVTICYASGPTDLSDFGDDPAVTRNQRSTGLASRVFVIDDEPFEYFVHDTTYFNTYFALRLSDSYCISRQLPGRATGVPTRTHLSSAHVDGAVVKTCLPQKNRLASLNNDKFGDSGLRLLTLDFDDANSHQTAQLGRGLTLAGACPQHYDGLSWTEQNFHVGPELISTAVAAGGSMTAAGTYLYRVWYEWTDTQGEVHRGPDSNGTSVSMGGGNTQVTLTLPTLRLTLKANVRICVARSVNGETSRLFRVTSLDPTTSGSAANGYVANSTSTDTVTFVDRMSDTNLLLQERAYTTGGVLSNDPSPLGSIVAVGKNRLFFNDSSDPNKVRYSQQLDEGYGVEIPPDLFVPVDPIGGDVTALAVMGDLIVVFKKYSIYAFNGDGPTATGDQSATGFTKPELLPSDVGCTSPSSIVLTPEGLMFQSAKGIYLLPRGSGQAVYVGAPAETYNSQTVRRASMMPDRSHVLFLTNSGKTLLYDFLFKQWSTFTNHEGLDAVVVDGSYHYLRNDDTVYQETIGSYSDGGTRITLRFETAWIHIWEHLQGFQRFWNALLLGTYNSPHQLGVQYQTDYETAWSDPQWLDATGDSSSTGWITGENANEIGIDPMTGTAYGAGGYGEGVFGGTDPDVYQWRIGLHVNGQAIQFRFEDFEKAGLAGASFELTELLIIGGVIKPSNRPFTSGRSA